MATERDPYRVLGLSPSASQAEIASAYRRLVHAHHPDTRAAHPPADQAADEHLQQVLSAYALLRDSQVRAVYDRAVTERAAAGTAEVKVPSPRRRPGRAPRVPTPPTTPTRIEVVVVDTPPPRPPATGLWIGPVRRHR